MSGLEGFGELIPLGSGGLGDVYWAVRRSTGTPVAIKVLRDWSDSSVAWQRAERELRALAELRGHPFVVQLEELVEVNGVPHLVMEYAPGGSVTDLLNARGGPLTVGEAVLIGEQTASALAASHELGIIHLDIKPQNLLIGAFGQVKVCDFGIAALTRTERFRERTSAVSYRYASPEQLEDDGEVGSAADLFSLGATLLHLLSGRPLPLRGDDATIARRVDEWVRPPGVTEEAARRIERTVARCLAPVAAARPTAIEVHDELEDIAASLGPARCRALQPVITNDRPTSAAGRPGYVTPDPLQAAVVRPPAAHSIVGPPVDPPTIVRQVVTAPPPPAGPDGRRQAWLLALTAAVLILAGAGVALAVSKAGADGDGGANPTSTAVTEPVVATSAAPTTVPSSPGTSVVVEQPTVPPTTTTTTAAPTTTSTLPPTTTQAPTTTRAPSTTAPRTTLPPPPPEAITDSEASGYLYSYLQLADGGREAEAWAMLGPCEQADYDTDGDGPVDGFDTFQNFWRNWVEHVEATGLDDGIAPTELYRLDDAGRYRMNTVLTYVVYESHLGEGPTKPPVSENVEFTFREVDGGLQIEDYAPPYIPAKTCDR